ncbi:MAG TPA: glycosyltransferase family 4 protein [Thermoleophilaceae bacterium]|nr:glycosyltransferase family 4 protein [Thermoleophilaceae bacterium]
MERRARILILLENEPYPYDTRVAQIARALAGAGHSVTVAAPAGLDLTAPEEVLDGVRVLRFPALPEAAGAAGYLREYGAALRRLRALAERVEREDPPDLVIACNPPDFLLLAARRSIRRGARVIFDHHDLAPELFEEKFGRRGLFHRALLAAERWTFHKADVVLSTNEAYAEIARTRGDVPADRVVVVRNAPDPDRIRPVEPDPALRGGRAHLVAWVGRISTQEGLGAVLDAADELRRRGRDDVTFALVGPGDAREDLIAETARRGLGDRVSLPGRVDADGVRRYVCTASVCLSVDPPGPLNDRSTMIKVLEYMTLGRPVIQTPLEQMKRLCGDATAYARPSDAGDLADRVEELLDDPAKAGALGERARRRIDELGLTWPDQIGPLLQGVQTALASSRS